MPIGPHLCGRCQRRGSSMETGWDYCAECGRTLCPEDMQRGCDGFVPAHSGLAADQALLSRSSMDRDTEHESNS